MNVMKLIYRKITASFSSSRPVPGTGTRKSLSTPRDRVPHHLHRQQPPIDDTKVSNAPRVQETGEPYHTLRVLRDSGNRWNGMKSTTAASNPVEQLKLLRSFVPAVGVGGTTTTSTSYTESELLECLKYSGYNVERAAELLITGQYKKTKTKVLNTKSSGKRYAKSAFFHSTTTSPIKTKNAAVSTTKPPPPPPAQQQQRKPPPSKSLPPQRVSLTPSHHQNRDIISLDDSLSSFPDDTIPPIPSTRNRGKTVDSSLSKVNGDTTAKQSSSSPDAFVVAAKGENEPLPSSGPYLLCKRWISNASITSRSGTVRYRESLQIDFTQTGYSVIKFRSSQSNRHQHGVKVEGRLPENIAIVLIPFLRYKPISGTLLISVHLESMMEDRSLIMGSTIPIQISIYINAVNEFFDVIAMDDSENNAGTKSKASQYFQNNKKENKPNSKKKKNTDNSLPMNEAAFVLFQWAEYGDVPAFRHRIPNTNNEHEDVEETKPTAKSTTTMQSDDVDKTKPTAKSAAILQSDIIDDGNDEEEEDDDDDENLQELAEEEFDKEEESDENREVTEISKQTMEMNSPWTDLLPDDMEDPISFRQYNISLRPYQKQALYFMLQRERVDGMTREQLDDQLQILNELRNEPGANHDSRPNRTTIQTAQCTTAAEIVCDCGPVVVSERGGMNSRTVSGDINPVGHPLWHRRFLASNDMKHSITIFVNELLGIVSHVPPHPPKHCSGGILADAMGLGKTVMLLALILKSKENHLLERRNSSSSPSPTATLVVAKLSLLPQWEEEIKTKTNLTYKVYYGLTSSSKPTNLTDFLHDVDVVITTYGTVQGELRQKHPVLLQCNWLRIILDEAHCIRNHRTLASKVCCQLKAEHRWCVTGTIIQNSLDDVYGIMKFLQHEPWCLSSFWSTAITQAASSNGADQTVEDSEFREKSLQVAIDRIRRLLSPIMIRRTKDSLTKEGVPILTLPPIECKIVKVDLQESEREFYNAVLARSLAVFDGFIKDGTAAKAYFQIFSLLSRLRQSCDHIALTVKSKIDDDEWITSTNRQVDDDETFDIPAKQEAGSVDVINKQFLNNLLKKFYDQQEISIRDSNRTTGSIGGSETSSKRRKSQAYVSKIANNLTQALEENASHIDDECPICLDRPKIISAVLTPCGHIFCRGCLFGAIRSQSPTVNTNHGSNKVDELNAICPTCQEKFNSNRILGVTDSYDEGSDNMEVEKPRKHGRDINENPFVIARQILSNAVRGTESSKMKAIMNELNDIWRLDPGSKVLMFSHYLGFLDLLGAQFDSRSIPYFRLDGSLNVRERMDVLDEFKTSLPPKPSTDNSVERGTVLLMSMSAGGEGLNIVSASSCFILEPWWNSAKEDQCQNRIHRFGQRAPLVRVRKFIVNDSVEERIVELQQKKAYVAGEIYCDNGHAANTNNFDSARLSLDDFRLIFRSK